MTIFIIACLLIVAASLLYGYRMHKLADHYRYAIVLHRAHVRDDPCWEWDEDLWRYLDDGDYKWPHGRYASEEEMVDGCKIYAHGCFRKRAQMGLACGPDLRPYNSRQIQR